MSDATETPALHLAHTDDQRQNRNWDILDSAVFRIAQLQSQTIPGDLFVQGILDVTRDATIHGMLTAGSLNLGDILAQRIEAQGLLVADAGVTVAGTVTLPPESVPGAALAPGAAVPGVWVGVADATQQTLVQGTPLQFAVCPTDASETTPHWSLVIAQATVRVQYGSLGPTVQLRMDLRRGATVAQSRTFQWDSSAALDGLDLDIPLTLVRVAQPDASAQWSLWGTVTLYHNGGLALKTFGQIHVIQFR
jgi:hypothetical protein